MLQKNCSFVKMSLTFPVWHSMIAIPSSYKCVVLSLTGQLLDLGHVCNIFAYRCFLFAIAMLRGPSWWHSAQLLFSILPWTSSQLLFSIHPWTSYQLLFSIHPWTSSQCELNTPVGLRPSCANLCQLCNTFHRFNIETWSAYNAASAWVWASA